MKLENKSSEFQFYQHANDNRNLATKRKKKMPMTENDNGMNFREVGNF